MFIIISRRNTNLVRQGATTPGTLQGFLSDGGVGLSLNAKIEVFFPAYLYTPYSATFDGEPPTSNTEHLFCIL